MTFYLQKIVILKFRFNTLEIIIQNFPGMIVTISIIVFRLLGLLCLFQITSCQELTASKVLEALQGLIKSAPKDKNGNIITDKSNVLNGLQNVIIGKLNEINGNENQIVGDSNDINGTKNSIIGDNNNVLGSHNYVFGQNNNIINDEFVEELLDQLTDQLSSSYKMKKNDFMNSIERIDIVFKAQNKKKQQSSQQAKQINVQSKNHQQNKKQIKQVIRQPLSGKQVKSNTNQIIKDKNTKNIHQQLLPLPQKQVIKQLISDKQINNTNQFSQNPEVVNINTSKPVLLQKLSLNQKQNQVNSTASIQHSKSKMQKGKNNHLTFNQFLKSINNTQIAPALQKLQASPPSVPLASLLPAFLTLNPPKTPQSLQKSISTTSASEKNSSQIIIKQPSTSNTPSNSSNSLAQNSSISSPHSTFITIEPQQSHNSTTKYQQIQSQKDSGQKSNSEKKNKKNIRSVKL